MPWLVGNVTSSLGNVAAAYAAADDIVRASLLKAKEVRAEAVAKHEAELKAEEERKKAEEEARLKAEEEARLKAEADAAAEEEGGGD